MEQLSKGLALEELEAHSFLSFCPTASRCVRAGAYVSVAAAATSSVPPPTWAG
jgi:hypothetical protein